MKQQHHRDDGFALVCIELLLRISREHDRATTYDDRKRSLARLKRASNAVILLMAEAALDLGGPRA